MNIRQIGFYFISFWVWWVDMDTWTGSESLEKVFNLTI